MKVLTKENLVLYLDEKYEGYLKAPKITDKVVVFDKEYKFVEYVIFPHDGVYEVQGVVVELDDSTKEYKNSYLFASPEDNLKFLKAKIFYKDIRKAKEVITMRRLDIKSFEFFIKYNKYQVNYGQYIYCDKDGNITKVLLYLLAVKPEWCKEVHTGFGENEFVIDITDWLRENSLL